LFICRVKIRLKSAGNLSRTHRLRHWKMSIEAMQTGCVSRSAVRC